MLRYDYFCPANQRTVEVRHSMNDDVADWADLCRRAEIDLGDTPPDSPVERLISGGYVFTSKKSDDQGSFDSCCSGGACGCN